ncbi:hypothetical protein BDN72DRAFT_958739 [Pluteus cervinus]|uniref:Uncharacterized protein n=1 Tax=Pluteus cervinus TaxID=181527 RepID=A0ACD3AXW3_9AGAR|nr:hypothetical protein BDN72DRAFT_958739 [Pluteus cervinus]
MSFSGDPIRIVQGARNGSPFDMLALAVNWTLSPSLFNDETLSIFSQHLNPSEVPVNVKMDPMDIEPHKQPPIASTSFLAFWSLRGFAQLLTKPIPDRYQHEIIRAWPGIFKWSTFFFASRVQVGTPLQKTSKRNDSQADHAARDVRVITLNTITSAWWAISRSSAVNKVMLDTCGFLEVVVDLWIHEDHYRLDPLELAACLGGMALPHNAQSSFTAPSSFLSFLMSEQKKTGTGVPFVERVLSVVGDIDRTALIVTGKLEGALKAPELNLQECTAILNLLMHFFHAPQVDILDAIMNHDGGTSYTKILVKIASRIQESYPKRCPDLEALLALGFGCVITVMNTTNSFSWIIQVVNAGILTAFVEASPVFNDLRDEDYNVISALFSAIIPRFLCYHSVVHAVDTMWRKLERTERFRSLPKSRAWKALSDLTKLTAERRSIFALQIAYKSFKRKATLCSNTQCPKVDSIKKFRKCGHCLSSFYCSKECQIVHWKGGHRAYCENRAIEIAHSDKIFSPRDQDFIEQLNRREAWRYLPYLKGLAKKEYPGIPLGGLIVIINYTRVPVTHRIGLESEYLKSNPELFGVPLDKARMGLDRTLVLGIFPWGKGFKYHPIYIEGLWSLPQRKVEDATPGLDPTGNRFLDEYDGLALAKWRKYWGFEGRP